MSRLEPAPGHHWPFSVRHLFSTNTWSMLLLPLGANSAQAGNVSIIALHIVMICLCIRLPPSPWASWGQRLVSSISVIPVQCLVHSRHWVSYGLKNRCYLPFRSLLIRLPSRSPWEGLLAEWWNSVLGLNENNACRLDKLTTWTRAFVGMNSSLTYTLSRRGWALLTIPQTWNLHAHDSHSSC